MPRPSINLEQWKEHIIGLYVDGAQPKAITIDIQKRTGLLVRRGQYSAGYWSGKSLAVTGYTRR